MLKFDLTTLRQGRYRVLCLGAHADDIEIGCGGTILKLAASRPDTEFYWVVFSADKRRATEARKSFDRFLKGARSRKIVVKNFKESFFPYKAASIKNYFEQLKKSLNPDLIFTHFRNDLHQDHRLISELTWNTFRNHFILEYEIPKYDGSVGSANLFSELDRATSRQKINLILSGFKSQKSRQWFDGETFLAALRLAGVEANSSTKYAEAFHCRKITLG